MVDIFFKNHEYKKLGGLNNNNYLINYFGKKYVLRIPCKENKNDYSNENLILELLNNENLSPKKIYHNPESGILLSTYLNSSNLTFNDFKSKKFLKALTKELKKFHNIKNDNIKTFNPFLEIRSNINSLKKLDFKFDYDIDIFLKKVDLIEKKYLDNKSLGLCHNDLNISNILYKDNKVYFIDFEFSGICDIYFDLATISWFLNTDERMFLLKSYFGEVDGFHLSKLYDYLYIVKLWNASWSLKKSLIAKSDYDYKLGGNLILDSIISYSPS